MKIRLFVLLAAAVLVSAACTRQRQPLQHDAAVGQQLAGRWEQVLVLESQIYTDELNPQMETGTVTSKSVVVLTLGEDQSFSIDSRQEFISYTPVEGIEPLPEEIVGAHFNQMMRVTGTFVSTAHTLEYNQSEISVNNQPSIPFEEFSVLHPDFGSNLQRVSWSLEADKLTIVSQDADQMTAVYTRIE